MEKIKNRLNLINRLCAAVGIIGVLVPIIFTVYELGFFMPEPRVELKPAVTSADAPILRIAAASDFAPHSYLDENGQLTGMNVELAIEMANRLGMKPEFLSGDWPTCRYLLSSGKVDVLMGLEVFSNMPGVIKTIPVDTDKMKIFSKNKIISFSSLAGKRVGIMKNSVIEAIYDFNCEYVEYNTNTDILKAVANGDVDYGICHDAVAEKIIADNNLPLQPSMSVIRSAPALGIEKNNVAMRDKLNTVIEAMTADGTVERLENKWTIKYKHNHALSSVFEEHQIFYASYPLLLLLCMSLLIAYSRKYKNQQEYIAQLLSYQRKLQQSTQETVLANRVKSEFLTHMSHDIRTPINGIMGMLDIIKEKRDDKKRVDDCLQKISSASSHLLSLINDVLDLSRLESGTFENEEKYFNIYDELQEVNDIGEVQAKEKGITYNCHVAKLAHSHLLGSTLYLRRILLNLFSNAVKYNKPLGTLDVYVREVRVEGDMVYLEFKIADTGIGMSPEFVQNNLFKPFVQEHNDARSQYNGTGLGMAIVKELTEALNGEISVVSKLGEGSTFVVILPFKIAAARDIPVKEVAAANIAGMRVLLVEDNVLNMEIAQFMLEQAQAVVTVAHDGVEAVEIFSEAKEYSFDAVLMDIMMPRLNGLEATKQIRMLERKDAQTVPIIAMTANAFAEDIKKTRQAGMNEHLSKPVNKDKLLQVLSKYYSRQKKEM